MSQYLNNPDWGPRAVDYPKKGLTIDQYRNLRAAKDRDNVAANRAAIADHFAGKTPAAKPKQKRQQEESQLQVRCVAWFRSQYARYHRLFFAIRNGGRETGTAKQRAIKGKRNKAEGVVPGAADLLLSIPRGEYHGLYIEMKVPGRYQKPDQKDFQADVTAEGYGYVVCKTLDEFMAVVSAYLGDGQVIDLKSWRREQRRKNRS